MPSFLPFGETLNLTRWQTIQVNEGTFETSVEGVFSGGDVVTGAATAIEAIAAGRKAAHAIDQLHHDRQGRRPSRCEFVQPQGHLPQGRRSRTCATRSRTPRRPMPVIPLEERARAFAEVEQGYTLEDVKARGDRAAWSAAASALFDCDLRRYATEYGVDIKSFLGEAKQYQVDRTHPLIELDPNKCILCGRCVRICSEVVGVAAYGFINRGFDTVVKPALGRLAARHRLRDLRAVHRHLPHRRDRGEAPARQARTLGDRATVRPSATTAASAAGSPTRPSATRCQGVALRGQPASPLGNHCRKGRVRLRATSRPRDRLRRAWIRAGRELQDDDPRRRDRLRGDAAEGAARGATPGARWRCSSRRA